jgi:uncharacterized SAM-binding protein YcdF (DUF218 family)/glycosyltransferase involved in cell wall biosynthesis
MLTGQNVICISSIDWDFIWQGHQQLMSMLAAQGNKVLFVENTGVRRPMFRDMSRLRQRIRNWRRGTKGFRRERENLFVYSPLVLPFPYSRIARWINRFIIVRAIRRWMKATGLQRPVVWTFLPTALALDLIKALDPELVVYYCIDDFEASSAGARSIRLTEHRLFQEADLVFVTSERLRERARQFRHQVDVFPFAVDFRRFEAVRNSNDQIPADLLAVNGPIVGYVGGLHRWIDQDLVTQAARRLPDISFVFIGPAQCDVSKLESEPTMRLLGARSTEQLPGYIKGFDVGIVPYVLAEYTANVYPTKLNEYLAMGKPVVATGLPEIMRFNRIHGDVVAVADDADAFAAQIRKGIQNCDETDVQKRIAVARDNSWDARLEGMAGLIGEALAARRAHRDNWEDRLRRLYRVGRGRALRIGAFAVLLYLITFQTPLIWIVAEPLRVVDPPRQADAIVVFAGGVGESGSAGGGYQERVRHAVDLYQAGYAPRLIFSSGFVFAFREADVMRDLALSLGVPAQAVVLEKQASSTFENVVFVRDILRDDTSHVILLVSSPYHMRRATLTWRKQAPDIEAVATPVPESMYYMHGSGASLEQIRGIAWEYAALLVYRWRGWL